MKVPRPRFSILAMLGMIALIAVGLAVWEHWVAWPAAQARFIEILETSKPKPDVLRTAESLVRRYPALARQEGTMTWAVINGDVETCRVFLDAGAEMADESNPEPNTFPLLYLPVSIGEVEKVQLLIERGAKIDVPFDVDFCNRRSMTFLNLAASFGHTEMCRLLLDHGADLNHQTGAGETPLHQAVRGRQPETLRFLLGQHAEIRKNQAGLTPLDVIKTLSPADLPPEQAEARDKIVALLEENQRDMLRKPRQGTSP